MKKVVFLLVTMAILAGQIVPSSAEIIQNTAKPITTIQYGHDINFTNASEGVVSVYNNNTVEKKMKLVVQLGTERYIYNLFDNSEYVNYPLQLGNGFYTVSVYQNTTGTKYKKITSKSFNVTLEDDNSVYLQSVLEISWDMEDESIRLADDLLAEALVAKRNNAVADKKDSVILSEKEKIDKLYSYVVENIIYDYDKIDGLEYSYVPHNDVTLELKAGICYDYSSLLASMLRSQGIPTKMVKGYANTSSVYHAWNEVFLSDEKRWVVVDTTFDAYREQNGYSYSFEKVSSNYNKVKEF